MGKENFTKLYFKIRRYKAALVAAETFRVEYPDSKYIPEIMYLSIESAYELAFASIRSKQEERLRDTINRYEQLIDKYPDSKYVKMAEKFGLSVMSMMSRWLKKSQK